MRIHPFCVEEWMNESETRCDWNLRYDADLTARELCVRLLEDTGVMLTPGGALGMEGYLRIGYANHAEILREGLDRFSGFLRSL